MLNLDDIKVEDLVGDDHEVATNEAPPEEELEKEELEEEEDVQKEEASEETPDETSEDNTDETLEEDEKQEEREEETQEDEIEGSLIDELASHMGVELDREYEDSIDGFLEFGEDAGQALAQSELNAIFEEFPDVAQYAQYRFNGGDPDGYRETFFQETYEDVEFQEDDESHQRTIITDDLKEQGYTEEEIEQTLDDYFDGGILERQARRSLSRLQRIEEDRRQELIEQQEQQAENEAQAVKEYWKGVEETIQKSDDFKGLPVPKGQKDDFFEYLSKDVTGGQGISQRDVDAQEADQETRLAIDLLLFYEFDLDDLIDLRAKSKSAKSLRDRLSKAGNGADVQDQSSNTTSPATEVDVDNLDLSSVFGQ